MKLRLMVVLAVAMAFGSLVGERTGVAPAFALAQIVVNGTADGLLDDLATNGTCDLREAVEAANTNAVVGACIAGTADVNGDAISFAIPGDGPHTIALVSTLEILERVQLDGSNAEPGITQCAAPRNLSIVITGAGAGDGIYVGPDADRTFFNGLVLNEFGGVALATSGADEVTIACSHIGTNREGTAASPNGFGVTLGNGSTLGSQFQPAFARNVVSGNVIYGVGVFGSSLVFGNHIGTNLAGTAAIPNGVGVEILESAPTAYIGNAPADGNLISGNSGPGVAVTGGANAIVSGNRIGTDITGALDLGNDDNGITVNGNTTRAAFVNNVIAFNAEPQVDLADDGPTANDANDVDSGPNQRQNYPVLTSATNTTIYGNTNGFANGTYSIDIYYSAMCGSPASYLGNAGVAIGANQEFTFTGTGNLPTDGYFFAAATNVVSVPAGYYTSEFGPCIEPGAEEPNSFDVDCENGVTVTDALAIMNVLAAIETGPQPTAPCDADVDNNASVNLTDVILVRRYVAGLII